MAATLSSFSDDELLEHIRLRDEAAFAELYDRYSSAIFNYLLRLTHEQQVAEDLLQETFLGSWRAARRFRNRSSVKTWLYRIAHNQTVSWLRKHRRHQPAFNLDEIELGKASKDWLEDLAIENWENGQLLEAIETLSEKHRAVIELTFGQQFSYAEIAEIVGCPVGTVKSRMSYALRQLEGELRRRVD